MLHYLHCFNILYLCLYVIACVSEYFEEKEKETSDSKDRIYEGYQAVLDSKSTDETLVSLFIILYLISRLVYKEKIINI